MDEYGVFGFFFHSVNVIYFSLCFFTGGLLFFFQISLGVLLQNCTNTEWLIIFALGLIFFFL